MQHALPSVGARKEILSVEENRLSVNSKGSESRTCSSDDRLKNTLAPHSGEHERKYSPSVGKHGNVVEEEIHDRAFPLWWVRLGSRICLAPHCKQMGEVTTEEEEKAEEAPSAEIYPTDMNTLLDWYQRERCRNEEWSEYLSELLPALRSLLSKWEQWSVPSAFSTSTPPPPPSYSLSLPQTGKASSLSLEQLISRGETMLQPFLFQNSAPSSSSLQERQLCPFPSSGAVDAGPPRVPHTTVYPPPHRESTAVGHEQEEEHTQILHEARASACPTIVASSSTVPESSSFCSHDSPHTSRDSRRTTERSSRPTSSGSTVGENDLTHERVREARVGTIVQESEEKWEKHPSHPVLLAKGVIVTGSVKEKHTSQDFSLSSTAGSTKRHDGGRVVGATIATAASIRMPTMAEGSRTTTCTVVGSAHSGRLSGIHHEPAGTEDEEPSSIQSSSTVVIASSAPPPLPCSSSSVSTTSSLAVVESAAVGSIPGRTVRIQRHSSSLPIVEGKTSNACEATLPLIEPFPPSPVTDHTEKPEEKRKRIQTSPSAAATKRMVPTTTEGTTTTTVATVSPPLLGNSLKAEEEAMAVRDWVQVVEIKYIQEVKVDVLLWREEVERLRTLMAAMEEDQRMTQAAYKHLLQLVDAVLTCVSALQRKGIQREKKNGNQKKIADDGSSDETNDTTHKKEKQTTPSCAPIGDAPPEVRSGREGNNDHGEASSSRGRRSALRTDISAKDARIGRRASPALSAAFDPCVTSPTTSTAASSRNGSPSPIPWDNAVEANKEAKVWRVPERGGENERGVGVDASWERTGKGKRTGTTATVSPEEEEGALPQTSSSPSSSFLLESAAPMELEVVLSELLTCLHKKRRDVDKCGTLNAVSQRLFSVEYEYCRYRACKSREEKELVLLRQKTRQLEGQIERLSSIQSLHTPVQATIASIPTGTALARSTGVSGSGTVAGAVQRGITIPSSSLPTTPSVRREMEESKKENEKRIEKMDAQMKDMQQKLDRRNIQVVENAKVISRLENTITAIQADNRSSRQAFQLLKRQFDELELEKELFFLEKSDALQREKAGGGDSTNGSPPPPLHATSNAASSTAHKGRRDTRDRELLHLQRGFMERKIRYDIESAQWVHREMLYVSSHHQLSLRVIELLHEVAFLEAVVYQQGKDITSLKKEEEESGEENGERSLQKATLVDHHSVPSSSPLHGLPSSYHRGGKNGEKIGRREEHPNESTKRFALSTEEEGEQGKRTDKGPIHSRFSLRDAREDFVDPSTSFSSQCFSRDGPNESHHNDRVDTHKTETNEKESDHRRRREKRIQEPKEEEEEEEKEDDEEQWRQKESTWEGERKALHDRLTQTNEQHEAEKRKWRMMVHELQRTVTLLKSSTSPSVLDDVKRSGEGGVAPLDTLSLFKTPIPSTPHRRSSSTSSSTINDPATERRCSSFSPAPASSAQREWNSMESFPCVPSMLGQPSSWPTLGGKTHAKANVETKNEPLGNPEGLEDCPLSLSHSPPPRAENTLVEGETVEDGGDDYEAQKRLWDEERRLLRRAVRDAQEKYEKVLKELDERPVRAKEKENIQKGAGVPKNGWSKSQKLFSTSSLTSSSPSFGRSGVASRRSADVKTIQLVLEETLMEKIALEERIAKLESEKKQEK